MLLKEISSIMPWLNIHGLQSFTFSHSVQIQSSVFVKLKEKMSTIIIGKSTAGQVKPEKTLDFSMLLNQYPTFGQVNRFLWRISFTQCDWLYEDLHTHKRGVDQLLCNYWKVTYSG